MDLSRLLDWSAFSAVAATSALTAPRFHSLLPNHFDNMIAACTTLRQRGFKRIGLAISEDGDTRVKHRWSGGLAWHNFFQTQTPIRPLITSKPGPEMDLPVLLTWVRAEKPDVVIMDATNQVALKAALASIARKMRPKIVTMNWPRPHCHAGIDQQPRHLGAAAVDVLAGLLTRGERGIPEVPHTTMLDGKWRETAALAVKRKVGTRPPAAPKL